MLKDKNRFRVVFTIAFAIGIIGALGQSFMLYHELVDCYPYKMMSFPSYEFYENIAHIGIIIAPLIAIIAGFIFGLKRIWSSTVIPVFLCPILFSVVYKIASTLRTASGIIDSGRNFDDTKPEIIFQDFLRYSVWLALIGLCVGIFCSFIITRFANGKTLNSDNQSNFP
jgi:surface polysaccharide O-acyltransferase-like enzyme